MLAPWSYHHRLPQSRQCLAVASAVWSLCSTPGLWKNSSSSWPGVSHRARLTRSIGIKEIADMAKAEMRAWQVIQNGAVYWGLESQPYKPVQSGYGRHWWGSGQYRCPLF